MEMEIFKKQIKKDTKYKFSIHKIKPFYSEKWINRENTKCNIENAENLEDE